MILLVDLSNSNTKFALSDGNALLEEKRVVPTTQLSTETLQSATNGWQFDRVVLSSVVPNINPLFAETFSISPLVVDHRVEIGGGIDFPNPETIGGDRLANAAAHLSLYKGLPGVVIDFGTAVTFDIIDTKGQYVGGVIAPGLAAMTDYLHEKTALLPRIELREPDDIVGKSTEEAMLSGAFFGYRGLVREILDNIRRRIAPGRWRPKFRVIATGGYADLIAPGVEEIPEVNPNLTLEGLRIIANLNTADA